MKLLTILAATALLGAAGELDPSFDRDGKKLLADVRIPTEVLVQPDGRIVVAGDASGDFGVARLHPDGSRDTSFDVDGATTVDFGGQDHSRAAALQPDGKLVVAGTSTLQGNPAVAARFNPDGRLDPTFDEGGKFGMTYLTEIRSVLVQPDGRIVLAGPRPNNTMGVSRLNPDGDFDDTTWADADFGMSVYVQRAALDSKGRIVVAGGVDTPEGRAQFALARFDADGTLDDTFGTGGKVVYDSGQIDHATDMVLQPDGKIVVVGAVGSLQSPSMLAVRFGTDGRLDRSFGSDGRARVDFDGVSIAGAAALQPDGKIVLAGTAIPPYDVALARLRPDGTLDPSFGTTTVDFGGEEGGAEVALQADGKIVVAGQSSIGAVLARLMPDPPPPASGPAPPPAATPRCAGRSATIVGTPGRDRLRGTRRADVIVALGGDDRVAAGGGRDLVCGGAGADRLSGGPGRDRLIGGHGRDNLLGGPGRDRLLGGPGRDRTKP